MAAYDMRPCDEAETHTIHRVLTQRQLNDEDRIYLRKVLSFLSLHNLFGSKRGFTALVLFLKRSNALAKHFC